MYSAAAQKCKFVVLILVLFCTAPKAAAHIRFLSLPFGQDTLLITWNDQMLPTIPYSPTPTHHLQYYQTLSQRDYQTYLHAVTLLRDSLKLNDWLYLHLLRQSLHSIFSAHSGQEKELCLWFFLSFSGIQTALAVQNDLLQTYVNINEMVFERPIIHLGQSIYMSTSTKGGQDMELIMAPFSPALTTFNVSWTSIPLLRPSLASREFQFRFMDSTYNLSAQFDVQLVTFLDQVPVLQDYQYFLLPFSSHIDSSLIHQLSSITTHMNLRQKTEFLLAFTRMALPYMDDMDFHGRSKPLFAEQVLFYPYSDCEDRAAFFFRLASQLLPLPLAIIRYDDHISLGIQVDWPCNATFSFNNKPYCLCDPTGPVDNFDTGQWPSGYEHRTFDIIMYKD